MIKYNCLIIFIHKIGITDSSLIIRIRDQPPHKHNYPRINKIVFAYYLQLQLQDHLQLQITYKKKKVYDYTPFVTNKGNQQFLGNKNRNLVIKSNLFIFLCAQSSFSCSQKAVQRPHIQPFRVPGAKLLFQHLCSGLCAYAVCDTLSKMVAVAVCRDIPPSALYGLGAGQLCQPQENPTPHPQRDPQKVAPLTDCPESLYSRAELTPVHSLIKE